MSYAIIKVGGKQYRVREGETLLVDRVKADEGKTFTPDLLFVPDGDGKGVTVTARVVGHVRGEKIRIGKYKRRTGYRRHTGFRASLTRIEIESIGAGKAASKRKAEPAKEKAPAAPAIPAGYDQLKVGDIAAAAKEWDRATLESALEYEQAHGKRKGAIAALESALAKED